MRKLHWYQGKRSACRPLTNDALKREAALSVADVTCKPCLAALGLSPIVFKARSAQAVAVIILPNGIKAECLVEEFEMKIVSAPALDNSAAENFIGQKPEPIQLKMRLIDAGWDSLQKAITKRL